MERTISSYKPAVSKKWLLFISGIAWLLASFILVRKGTFFMFYYSHHILFNLVLGSTAGVLFYAFIFRNVVKKHITRISKLDSEKPCLFAFTGINGYFMIALMISLGVFLSKFHFINLMSLNVFYICMGSALFFSSIKFFFTVLTFKKFKETGASSV